ncbi:LuxR family transcriptional regulator [Arthrobacter sp. PAMC25564]|uniref:LuxR C-terminal-related transcriptional regulator n=1 Tax=Arthrobacter sp. PAMC25564 TaxID=2565366 RepID=UPI0010A234A5|nr:LuxR C-terminal-related transcriptional regulator [Arthrobacter sp. PAMC25564]QCB95709.1 LuxR family transcriptional regulator [Arthrobacter sp. PAMC25564]
MPTGPPSASSKFRAPEPVGQWVHRARLTEMLHSDRKRRLALIHAPAGFGKSTLAAQWMEILAAQGLVTVWLSLDRDDNNTIWFLSHLLQAIRKARPGLNEELQQLLEERPDDAEQYVVPALINAIDEDGQDIVITLDDWHLVTEPRTRAVVERLLDAGGSHLSFIITSRSRAGLPLGRLMVRDQLLEVDAVSLRFDEHESKDFLVGINRLDLDAGDVASLHQTTEGWIAALQLVSLSLRDHREASELIERLSGRHASIGEYLAENVLDTLDPETLDFLLMTSVPERLCAGLASALSGVELGQAMLEKIQAQDLFLQPLDEDGTWYRYHHLFEDYLRRRLERDYPGRTQELNLIAARWYAENGFPSDGVDHALAAGDVELGVEIVESRAMWLVEHSSMSTLLALVGKIPADHVAGQARLQMAVAWAHTLLHQSGAAQSALDLAEAVMPADATLTEHDRFELGVEGLVVQSCIDMYGDRVNHVDELDEKCFAQADLLRPWIVSVAANVSTFKKIHDGDYPLALEQQRWAAKFHGLTSGPFSGVYGQCFAGLAAYALLDLDSVDQHFTAAVELGRRKAGRYSHAARLAGAMMGQLLYERGELDKAEKLLEETHELGSEGGVVDFMISTFATLARIKALRGDASRAREILDEGDLVADSLGLDRLKLVINLERVQLGISPRPGPAEPHQAMLPAAAGAETAAAAEAAGPRLEGLAEARHQILLATQLRSAMAGAGRAGQGSTTATVNAARHLLARATAYQGPRAELNARIVLSAALEQAGHRDEAEATLLPALATCCRLGLVRPVLDGGPSCLELVRALSAKQRRGSPTDGVSPELPRFLSILIRLDSQARTNRDAGWSSGPAAQTLGSATTPVPEPGLSQREQTILHLVEKNRSNREIAQELHLGINTVKWYLKSLFNALGVSDRRACVTEARRRHLLPPD